jgi:hypothetical protein
MRGRQVEIVKFEMGENGVEAAGGQRHPRWRRDQHQDVGMRLATASSVPGLR